VAIVEKRQLFEIVLVSLGTRQKAFFPAHYRANGAEIS